MQKQFSNDQEFKKALSERGMTVDRLRADARVDMAINKMIEDEVALEPEATDVQVREFYDKNPDKFQQEEAVRASHILIRVEPEAPEPKSKRPAPARRISRSRPRRAPTSPSWRGSIRPTAAPQWAAISISSFPARRSPTSIAPPSR
jgi:hypothetical protein